MSYILDALRKADAQRQRSRLPGLHAQATSPIASDASPGWSRSPLAWAAVAGVLALAIGLAWRALQPPTVPAVTPPAVTAAAPVAAPAPARPPLVAAAPASAPVVASAIEPAAPPPRPAPPKPAPARPVAQERAPAAARAASATGHGASAPTAVAQVPPAAAQAPESSVPPQGAPKLVITGGVYSPNPAQRMLIVGGQVFSEGSEVAPGVVLEQVRPNQALLRFQGQRFTQRY